MSGDRGTTAGRALCSLTWLLPRRADYAGLRRSWPRNLAAGVTVGVVALPLVLAAIVYAASGLVGRILLVALAGVLLVTAVRMVERHTARAVLTSTRGNALVVVLTALGTVAVGTLAPLLERGHVFATAPEAVAHAARHVAAEPPTSLAVAATDRARGPSWSTPTDALLSPSRPLTCLPHCRTKG
jgi:4-amino-4-deoxy-L-arabinose transferase-like glycosyltransferase